MIIDNWFLLIMEIIIFLRFCVNVYKYIWINFILGFGSFCYVREGGGIGRVFKIN